MSLQVRRETFDSLLDEWRALAGEASQASVFLTPAWQRVWWERCRSSEELLLLAFREGGEIKGIAPLMRSEGTVRFIGYSDVCDYHDFLFSRDGAEEFYPALLEELMAGEGHALELDGLAEESPTLQRLPALARERGLLVEQMPDEVSPRALLPLSWDDYLHSLGKKDRHELRRKLRRLTAQGEVSCYDGAESQDLARNVTAFLDLMKGSREEKARFMTDSREQFFHSLAEAMAQEGYLKLFFMELNGSRVAAAFCLDYCGTYYLYNSGYDTQHASLSVGLLLKALCLKDAIELGKRQFDFLRGAESYKYDLGAQDRQLYKLSIHRSSNRSRPLT